MAPARGLSLEITGPFAGQLPASDDNLVLRAARALASVGDEAPRGAAIRLVKNLPVSSGIGGGSSDAAATLKALDALWRLGAGAETLARLGLGLGADVPVCLTGRTARIGGIGERIVPVPALPRFGVVLVNPGIPVPTAAVFKALGGRFSGPAPEPPGHADCRTFADWLRQRDNDLARPAMTIAPEIADVLRAIATTGQCLLARLSGSGATCFGLYPDDDEAVTAARSLAADHPAWWIVPARFVEDAPIPIADARDAAEPHPR